MIKKYLSLVPAVSIFLFASGVAGAVSVPDNWVDQAERLKGKFKVDGADVPKANREVACKSIRGRTEERWQRYYVRKNERVQSYDRGIKIIDKRLELYEARGFTGDELADLSDARGVLVTMITEYKNRYELFLNALGDAKTVQCGNFEGGYLPKLKDAKTAWDAVKEQAASIKAYYRETVKPIMQELNAGISDKVNETEEE